MVRTLAGGAIGLMVAWFVASWAARSPRDFRVLVGITCVVGALCGARAARVAGAERRSVLVTGAIACLVLCLAMLVWRGIWPY